MTKALVGMQPRQCMLPQHCLISTGWRHLQWGVYCGECSGRMEVLCLSVFVAPALAAYSLTRLLLMPMSTRLGMTKCWQTRLSRRHRWVVPRQVRVVAQLGCPCRNSKPGCLRMDWAPLHFCPSPGPACSQACFELLWSVCPVFNCARLGVPSGG